MTVCKVHSVQLIQKQNRDFTDVHDVSEETVSCQTMSSLHVPGTVCLAALDLPSRLPAPTTAYNYNYNLFDYMSRTTNNKQTQFLTTAQQMLRWATVWPQQTWAEKVGSGCCGGWVPISHNVAWAEAYIFTKWHLDPSNCLATILGMPRSSAQEYPYGLFLSQAYSSKHLQDTCTELLLDTS